MSRFALLLVLMFAGSLDAQPARNVFPPPDVAARSTSAFSATLTVAPEWKLVGHPSVQQELALTVSQKAAIAFLSEPMSVFEAVHLGTLGLIPPVVTREYLTDARESFIKNKLNDTQRSRLKQVAFQLKEREFGAHVAFAMAARELGLRIDQLEDVTSIKGQRVEDIAKLVTSGERFDKVKPKVEAANGETYEKMAEMLTRTQREKWNGIRGAAFKAIADLSRAPPAPVDVRRFPKELFGLYELELYFLDTKAIQTELKFDEAQTRKLSDGLNRWQDASGASGTPKPEQIARAHQATVEILGELLTKEQRTRLNQIMMHRRELVSPEAMCGHPVAVEKLKITPIQLQKLSAGESIQQVLSDEQRTARLGLLGEPFEIPFVAKDSLGIWRPRSQEYELAYAFARRFLVISDRLLLSEDQIRRLRELATDEPKFVELIDRELGLVDTSASVGAGRSFTPAGAVSEQFLGAVRKQCWSVLDEKQQSIARQILYGKRR